MYITWSKNGDKEEFTSFEDIKKLQNYDDIYMIDCYNNQLTELPILPKGLKELFCYGNKLYKLPLLPDWIESVVL